MILILSKYTHTFFTWRLQHLFLHSTLIGVHLSNFSFSWFKGFPNVCLVQKNKMGTPFAAIKSSMDAAIRWFVVFFSYERGPFICIGVSVFFPKKYLIHFYIYSFAPTCFKLFDKTASDFADKSE